MCGNFPTNDARVYAIRNSTAAKIPVFLGPILSCNLPAGIVITADKKIKTRKGILASVFVHPNRSTIGLMNAPHA